MLAEDILVISAGLNLLQFGLYLHEKRLRLSEKEKFASYIKATDKRLTRMEKKDRLLQ